MKMADPYRVNRLNLGKQMGWNEGRRIDVLIRWTEAPTDCN